MPRTTTSASPFVDPAPGGQWGRTDEGVDWSNIRGNIGAVASGVITNVYHGLKGFGTTVIEKVTGGQQVYYGLETGGGAPVVQAGEQVQQGQPIAPGLGSGVIEVGYWDPSTGRPVGAPGYREGFPTRAGQRFRGNISRAPASSQPKTPITRPGGDQQSGGGVKDLFERYNALRNTPRTAPPGTKNPAKWFLASFTGEWDRFAAGGAATAQPSTGPTPSVVGHVTTAMLTRLAAPVGWSEQEVTDWQNLIRQESGGDPNAVNKSSGAFGIGQMLASGGSPTNLGPNMAKYRAYGGDPGSVLGQLLGMRGYIQQTYGSPSKAWAHEKANNWY